MNAYVLIQTEAIGESVAEKLRAIPGVITAEDLTGAYDAIVLARAGSVRHLTEGVLAEIQNVPGVSRALPAPLIHSPVEDPIDRPDPRVGARSQAA